VFDEVLGLFESMSKADIGHFSIQELEDLCRNPAFELLCRVCDSVRSSDESLHERIHTAIRRP